MRAARAALYTHRHRDADSSLLCVFRVSPVPRCLISTSTLTPSKSSSLSPPHILTAHHTLSSKESMASLDNAMRIPHVDTLIPILHHCKKQRNPQFAMLVHAYMCDLAAETHPCLGNHLIPMLVYCGNVGIAQQVFDKFIHVNEHSCLSLIQEYVDSEDYDRTFAIFDIMQERCINPSMFALQALVKATSRRKCLAHGRKLHLAIVQAGCEKVPFVSITLVDMYAKCNSLLEAQDVFDEMKVRDVVAWNALISGYVKHELYEGALECYSKMKLDMVDPDACTFLCGLKACCNIKAIERGREIHAEIAREGLEGDLYLLSATVDLYAKNGLLAEAQEVFDQVSDPDVVSWNALIMGYAEHGLATNVLICLEQMQLHGVSLSPVTYVCCLAACSSLGFIRKGQGLHNKTVKEGFDGELHVGSALVDMYFKFGLISEAKEAFAQVRVRDAVSWTTVIAGYADVGFNYEALDCLEQMLLEGVFPDAVAYLCCLKACGSVGTVGRGCVIHASIVKDGFDNDLFVSSTLVDMYAKCGLLTEALDLFKELPGQDVVVWNSLLAGYACQGESGQVFRLLERMITKGIQPDEVTLLNVLTVCSHAGLIGKGLQHFQLMRKAFSIPATVDHYTSMVDLLARAGQLGEAVVMLERMCFQPNLVTWTAVLGACQKSGNIELAREAFERAIDVDDTQIALFLLMLNSYSNAHMTKEERDSQLMAD